MDSTAQSTRCCITDSLKGFAIACVVLGHSILRTVPYPASNPVYLTLSSFEMPLFMFLSGYVLPGRVHGPRATWAARRVVRLMVPFIAWHTIFYVSSRLSRPAATPLAEQAMGLGAYLLRMISAPTPGLWYLPSLALCSLMLAALYPLRTRPVALAAVGWVAFVVIAQLRVSTGVSADFGLLKTVSFANSNMWLFFAAGFAYAQVGRDVRLERPLAGWPLLLFPLVAAGAMQSALALSGVAAGAAKVVLGLAGTAFAVVLLNLAQPLARRIRLDALGRLTLGIYCSHWLFLRVSFGEGALAVLATFVFSLSGAALVSWLITKWVPAKAVLLGEWPRRARPVGAAA